MYNLFSCIRDRKKNSSYENSPRPHQSPWAFNTQPFPHVKKDKLQGIFCIFSISKALQMDSMGTTKHNLITLITLFANSGRGQSSKWSTKWFLTSYINGSLWTSFHIVPFLGNKTAGLPVRLNKVKKKGWKQPCLDSLLSKLQPSSMMAKQFIFPRKGNLLHQVKEGNFLIPKGFLPSVCMCFCSCVEYLYVYMHAHVVIRDQCLVSSSVVLYLNV